MLIKKGVFLKSSPALDKTYFAGATIFITEYNAEGAVGFVVNRPFGRSLNDLEEFRHSRHFSLFEGGPVDQEHLFFLHQKPDMISDGSAVGNGIYNGGNFKEALTLINNKTLSPGDIKLFVGYCGWNAGELEAEIAEGSWIVTDDKGLDVFAIGTT